MITARPTGKPSGEFFGEGYGFRKLGKVPDDYRSPEFQRLLHQLSAKKSAKSNPGRQKAWKAAHPDACREHKRKSIAHRMEVDRAGQLAMRRRRRNKWRAKNKDKMRAAAQRKHARKKFDPAYVAAARARAAEWQRRAMADPVKAAAIRARKAEWARNNKLERRAA